MGRGSLTALAACALALMLSACETAKPGAVNPVSAQPRAPTATLGLAPAERIRKAVELLGHGQAPQARLEIEAALAQDPATPQAASLLRQIDEDPKVLLGEKNYVYKVKPGETMAGLAARFLGDPMMFYALARYNGVAAPADAPLGEQLLIPGAPKPVAPPPRKAAPAAATAAPAAVRDPARASQLRRSALEAMNKGAVARAVPLLRQALALDPDNGLIKRDLDRAVRIQASLATKH
jgi:hypothetical protein